MNYDEYRQKYVPVCNVLKWVKCSQSVVEILSCKS
jgi:hypothetical protein